MCVCFIVNLSRKINLVDFCLPFPPFLSYFWRSLVGFQKIRRKTQHRDVLHNNVRSPAGPTISDSLMVWKSLSNMATYRFESFKNLNAELKILFPVWVILLKNGFTISLTKDVLYFCGHLYWYFVCQSWQAKPDIYIVFYNLLPSIYQNLNFFNPQNPRGVSLPEWIQDLRTGHCMKNWKVKPQGQMHTVFLHIPSQNWWRLYGTALLFRTMIYELMECLIYSEPRTVRPLRQRLGRLVRFHMASRLFVLY